MAELHNNYSVSLSGGKTASSHWAKVTLVLLVVEMEEEVVEVVVEEEVVVVVVVKRDVSTGSIVLP